MQLRKFRQDSDTGIKFWNIVLDGTMFSVNFGKVGTKGAVKSKDFSTETEAQTAVDKLIDEKLKKGYYEL